MSPTQTEVIENENTMVRVRELQKGYPPLKECTMTSDTLRARGADEVRQILDALFKDVRTLYYRKFN